EYKQDKQIIVGTGNVSVTYGDVVLTCDTITVHTDTKLAVCDGNVRITQPGIVFTGERIEYNFETKTGKIMDGDVSAPPIYGHADEVDKVSEKEVVLNEGYITTCDLEKPHYRIRAKRIKFFINEKIVAESVFFYIGDVPVLYIPYYAQPLKDLRTKITVVPGYSDPWGYYLLGAYRYFYSEQCKGYLRLEYRTKRGLGEGVDYSFDAGYLGDGTARYYYTQENNILAMSPSGKVTDRYRFEYNHVIDFTDDTQGVIELNKVSDADMIKDYFFSELEDGWSSENYVSVRTNKENYSLELMASKRFDDFFTVTEKLPKIHLEVNNQRLWDTSFYYYNDMSFTNFNKRYADTDDMENEEAARFDTYNKLSYVTKLFGFLHATPYGAVRQTYYSRNKWGRENVMREIYEYGIDFSADFYKVMEVESKPMDINRLRHVFSPTIGFHHRSAPSVSPDNLFQFDSIDAIDYENAITFNIENKLQTKRKFGEDWRDVDVVRWIVSTEYPFRFKKGNLAFKGEGRFTDIRSVLEIKPFDWLFLKSDMTMYFKDYQLRDCIRTANTDIVCDINDKFNFGMGHIYENAPDSSMSQFTTQIGYKINKDWGVRIYERFDAYKKTWEEQEYTIFKDLHCWLAELTCNIRDGEFNCWVVFRLKAFPQIPIGFNRTYRRPTPGMTMTK
ncbi:MAG: LptA/OstA family protein, partial [Candidatus Omnitrophota bacterium]